MLILVRQVSRAMAVFARHALESPLNHHHSTDCAISPVQSPEATSTRSLSVTMLESQSEAFPMPELQKKTNETLSEPFEPFTHQTLLVKPFDDETRRDIDFQKREMATGTINEYMRSL